MCPSEQLQDTTWLNNYFYDVSDPYKVFFYENKLSSSCKD